MSDLRNALERIRFDSKLQNESLSRRILLNASIGIAIGAEPSGNSSLAIRIAVDQEKFLGEIRDSEGITFGWSEEDYGPGRWFAMLVDHEDDGEIFNLICEDLEKFLTVAEAAEAIRGTASRIRTWQRFLAVGRRGLSSRQQMGLWGELQVLEGLATSMGWGDALQSWTGPTGASQDFRAAEWSTEVKTTSLTSNSLSISSLDQLDLGTFPDIFIVHICASEVGSSEGESLGDAVSRLRAKVQGSPTLRSELETKLLSAGYHSMHQQRYSGIGFLRRSCSAYKVREDFPRFQRSSVPAAIKEARYTLQVKDLVDFAVNVENLPQALHAVVSGWATPI